MLGRSLLSFIESLLSNRGGGVKRGRAVVALPVLAAAVAVACSTADLKPTIYGPTSEDDPTEIGDEDGDAPRGPGNADGGDELPAGTTLATSSGVTIQVQPSDSGKALHSAISAAKKSVHMTMYLLTDSDTINALGTLKKAGKDVKVVLNKEFPPNGGNNQTAYNSLKSKGVDVVWAPPGYTFTHAKTVVIDGTSALIMTMNLTESSAATNREYIATDTDPEDVAQLEEIFVADSTNKAIHLDSKLVISPADANSRYSPRAQITALIDSAKSTLDFEVQSLSDTSVVDALIRAHEAKVAVRVVTDGDTLNTPAQEAAATKLKEHGVPLRSLKSPDMHAKAIVADGARAFVGSQNMTPTALDQNREIGVITAAAAEAEKVQSVIASDFAKGTTL